MKSEVPTADERSMKSVPAGDEEPHHRRHVPAGTGPPPDTQRVRNLVGHRYVIRFDMPSTGTCFAGPHPDSGDLAFLPHLADAWTWATYDEACHVLDRQYGRSDASGRSAGKFGRVEVLAELLVGR